jgi:hypothetical protein
MEDLEPAGLVSLGQAARQAIADAGSGVQVDTWVKGKRWPDPSHWTAEQWCQALVAAGRFAAGDNAPGIPPDEHWQTPPQEPAQQPGGTAARPRTLRDLHIKFSQLGISDREKKLGACVYITGRDLDSSSDLTGEEISAIWEKLNELGSGGALERYLAGDGDG